MDTEETPLLNRPDVSIKSNVVAAIVSTWIATFLAAADTTITATLSSTIAHEFDSLTIISWLGSGYLIGLTATQPLSGKLSDIFGRKVSFCFATCMFTIGNLICGLARSKAVLILARVLAGIGGGGCISIATFIASDHIPLKRRGTWQGTSAVMFTLGISLGAVVGGAVNDAFGWRWAFIGIAPISLVSCVLVAIFLPSGMEREQGFLEMLSRVDFAGCVTLVTSLVLLLVGLNHEGDQIVTLQFFITIPLGAACFALFLFIEWHWAKEPIIPLSLFRRRSVVATCLTAWFMSSSVYILLYYVPLYFQMLGHTPSEVGLRILPYSIGSGVGSFLIGLIIRVTGKYGSFLYITPLSMVIATLGFAFIERDSPWFVPELYLLCKGVGIGGAMTVLILAMLHVVPHQSHATGTSALYAFRSVGSTVGLSVASAIFYGELNKFERESGSSCKLTDDCYLNALHGAFRLAVAFACMALLCGFLIESNSKGKEKEDEVD
ncbi:Major facilitator superfamily domain general substrate transporter [Penicillium cinerascens]|uniref:Major facilitator superfamily domain general substrate transporter n=1 Tax=Penicillium cinerascens TaxID=70096 RepID=A0A9W9TDA4_9EURO|nr:Major facilitator superfamily domain general substrate transporter [Penicillium cinerascens]KAJ5218582.1 Major facilitator superfamily domain general substrate transporter [Penicillium cinerascens]